MESFVTLNCLIILSRLLASGKCLPWASVALQRCWWVERRLVSKHGRNWAPNLFAWALPKILAISSAKRCAGMVPLQSVVSHQQRTCRGCLTENYKERGAQNQKRSYSSCPGICMPGPTFGSFWGRCKPSHNELNYAVLLEVALKLVSLGLVVYARHSLQLAPLKTHPNMCLYVLMINILLLWCMYIMCTTTKSWHRTYILVVLTTVQGQLFDCFVYLPLHLLVLSSEEFQKMAILFWTVLAPTTELLRDLSATGSIRECMPSCTHLAEMITRTFNKK